VVDVFRGSGAPSAWDSAGAVNAGRSSTIAVLRSRLFEGKLGSPRAKRVSWIRSVRLKLGFYPSHFESIDRIGAPLKAKHSPYSARNQASFWMKVRIKQKSSRYICLNCRHQQHTRCMGAECDCVCKELRMRLRLPRTAILRFG